MPKVSVIVPVFNVEKYINTCIDSICFQTLSDIEIICVDDGSTDLSGRFLDEYINKDSRIKVLHRQNAGYGAAMNAGIAEATGEYIGIVESDDKIESDMFETLYKVASENELDMVKSDCYYWLESVDYLRRIHFSHLDKDYDRVLTAADRNVFFDFFMNIWTGIYKKSFLDENEIRFHESPGASYQDNGFWMQTCLYAKRAMWLNKAFYYYRQDNSTASVKSEGKMKAMTCEYEFLENLLKKRGHEEYLPYCWSMKLFRLRGTYFRIADDMKLQFINQIRKDYEKYKAHIRYHRYIDSWIREILSDPEIYTKKLSERKKGLIKKLEESESIIIYGTGFRGDMVFRTLYNEGFAGKICCFARSTSERTEVLAGRPILQIDEALKQFKDAVVLIAVIKGSGAYMAMEAKLMEKGVTEYLDASTIEECFYIL